MAIKSYSPDTVSVVVGVLALSGFADGTFVQIEPMTDGVSSQSGADGEVARAISLDQRHTITITLQQTSPANTYLSGLADADRISGGNGVVAIAVTDLRGETLFGGTGWVVKKATATYSKEIETREWQIEAVGEFISGGQA